MSLAEAQAAKHKAFSAVTATVTNEATVIEALDDMGTFGDMIDEAAAAVVEIKEKTEDWYKRMLIITPWVKAGDIKIEWRQVKLAPESLYVPYVTFRSGLEMLFDPIAFPTSDDVIQITLALKAGQ